MTEMTPQQKIRRENLKHNITDYYKNLFSKFFARAVLDLPQEMIVLTSAYKINREIIALEQAKEVIDTRLEILKKMPDPQQLEMF